MPEQPFVGSQGLPAENGKWLEMARELNKLLIDLCSAAMDRARGAVWDKECVAVRILLRSQSNLAGVVILTERGMAAEGRTLVRMMVEGGFALAALIEDGDNYITKLKEDAEASRKRQSAFILDKILPPEAENRAKLQTACDLIGKVRGLNQMDLAKSGALKDSYLLYQRLSDDAAHVSALSLNRYVVKTDSNTWRYRIGPASL